MIRTCSRIAAAVLVPVLAGVVTAGPALAAPQPQAPPHLLAPLVTEVPCNSGPPEPIQLRVQNGGDICFGGTVGVESVGLHIAFMDSGGYYGNLLVNTGRQCAIVPFRPRKVFAVNQRVCGIEITPPPRGTDRGGVW